MTVLVTGCAGFIGLQVCRILLEDGQPVEGLDDLNDAYDIRLKNWRLSQLKSYSKFRFRKLDISDYPTLRSVFASNEKRGLPPFASVVNLGARAGVQQSVANPWSYYQANTIGTMNLLEASREFKVKKFLLASTSSVYGADTARPFKEDSDTNRPLSPYAASKKAAETLLYSYHHLYGLDASVLRYFTVYGPAGRPDMSIFKFVRAVAEGQTITIFGDGRQERDFTYVDDVGRGTVAAIKPLGYEVINLGADRPVVLAEVISMIENCLKRRALITYAPSHPADIRATWADISQARNLLGWRPQVSIEEGIKRTVHWYVENRAWVKDIAT